MYKVFSGEKCVVIATDIQSMEKDARIISFSSAEKLHNEFKVFYKQSRQKKLIITGGEKKIWTAFRSLFLYIESSGGIVKNEQGELLMIYRNRHWDLPKGKMENGESPALAAIREVEEECGVKNLKIIRQISSTYHIYFQNNECMKRTYWYAMICRDSAKPKPQAEEGIKEAKWMSKTDVKKLWDKIYPSLHDVITAASF